MAASLPDYILHIVIQRTESPEVSRVLTIPAATTFHKLHLAIQIAFGWVNCHMYKFDISRDPPSKGKFTYTRPFISIQEEEPDYLGFDPFTGKEEVKEEFRASKKTKLSDVLENADLMDGSSIEYEYDFGDGWAHAISVVGRTSTTNPKPVCISGEGLGPSEDCGGEYSSAVLKIGGITYLEGEYGWKTLKEAYNAPRPSEDQKERMQWYEKHSANGIEGGLANNKHWVWDRADVNNKLRSLPKLPKEFALG